jgi:aspartyl-tRNA(Asn)/glutamyl-tRNA(Gln) amidotransferase subunit A
MDIASLSITSVRESLAARRFSATELAAEALRFAEAENPKTNAYLHLSPERAMAGARAVDEKIARGEALGALAGVPVAVKDVILTKGIRTTCGSKLLENFVAPYDATAISRIEAEGGMILGKTNCDEFAMGSSNENSAFGPVRNPFDPARSPGGSSGGSAASLAAGIGLATIGTDTGGSIRIPAAACGLVGLKPALGEVSTDGVVPLSRTMDHVGPLTHSVADACLVYHALLGDHGALPPAPIPLSGLRLAVLRPYFCDLLDHEVRAQPVAGLSHAAPFAWGRADPREPRPDRRAWPSRRPCAAWRRRRRP